MSDETSTLIIVDDDVVPLSVIYVPASQTSNATSSDAIDHHPPAVQPSPTEVSSLVPRRKNRESLRTPIQLLGWGVALGGVVAGISWVAHGPFVSAFLAWFWILSSLFLAVLGCSLVCATAD